jgi:DNA-binding response OmpR family regulator
MRLLLVEDQAESANLLVRVFVSSGFDVVHKTHGLEGLKAARSETFDAILLDFNLPDIDGSQIGLLLRPLLRDVPIIALTAHADKITRNKAKMFGFNAFIPKPWDREELINTLKDLTSGSNLPAMDDDIELVETKLTTQELKAVRIIN